MSSNLKKLVEVLERMLHERDGSLDAPAQEEFQKQIDKLKEDVDEADASKARQLIADALTIGASLLSVVTNVMSLWK